MSSGAAIFASITVNGAAGDGISLLTVQNVQHQVPLMDWCTCMMELAADLMKCFVMVTLRASVKKSTRVLCALDSGSAIVVVTDLLMLTQAGTQCPEST